MPISPDIWNQSLLQSNFKKNTGDNFILFHFLCVTLKLITWILKEKISNSQDAQTVLFMWSLKNILVEKNHYKNHKKIYH